MAHRRPANADALLRQADRLISAAAYRQPSHPDYGHVQEAVAKLYRAVYGTGPVPDRGIEVAVQDGGR